MQHILKDDQVTNMDGTDHMRLQETFDEDYMGSNSILTSDKKRNSIKVKEKRKSKKGPNIL